MIRSAKFEIGMIILVGIMAYGLQIPFLGFFQDDWNFVYYYSMNGTQGLLELMSIDGRPAGVWVYSFGFELFGFNPALWQLFSISFRILTAITAVLILNRLLPERRNGNLIASILFLIYPFFTLQPLSVSFAQHYVAYFLFGLSVLFTILSIERPDKYLLYSAPAVLLTFIHLFTVEYFVGLELLRLIVIWVFISRKPEQTLKLRLGKTILFWLPYFFALVFFVVWRSFVLAGFDIRNDPINIFTDSGKIALSVARYLFADLVLMLVNSWFGLINPELFVIGPIRNLFIVASILVSGASVYYFCKTKFLSGEKSATLRVFLIAGLIIAAGMIPAYSIGYIMNNKLPPWNSRFSLPALLGPALIVSEVISIFVTSPRMRLVAFSILIGLTIGHHNANMFNFKTAWEKQERFYQQLLWRAPSLKPNTAIVSSEEFLAYMGDYPTSMAINTLYETKPDGYIPYWLFTLSDQKANRAIANGEKLYGTKSTVEFLGNSSQAVYITFEPENDQCLWAHRTEDKELQSLPASMRSALESASLTQILETPASQEIFSRIVDENRNTWCFFYEKADLARQYDDWASVVDYWEQAESEGYRPRHGFEYIPFIQAYAHTGNWELAYLLTKASNKTTKAMYFILCPTWAELLNNTPPSEQKNAASKEAIEYLGCVQ